jgi:hypothetical protein
MTITIVVTAVSRATMLRKSMADWVVAGFAGTKTRLPGPGSGLDEKSRKRLIVPTDPFEYSTRVRPLSASRA